jgi:phospholipid-binding lipoprotein MlaA
MQTKTPALLVAAMLCLPLAACATAPADPAERAEYESTNDPLEGTNRAIFEFNQVVDRILLKPLAETYRAVLPQFAQDAIGNVLYNSGEPVRFANAVLQGRADDAGKIFNRFLVNTTAGLGGIADLAGESGRIPQVSADFGQTLHTWGAPEGPYLVLPILGPSNPRDAIGFAVDTVAQPWSYVVEEAGGVATRNRYTIADLGATAMDRRSKSLDGLEALEKGSLDFYAQLRSVSRQYRNKQLGIANPGMGRANFDDEAEPYSKPKPKNKRAKAKPSAMNTPATPVVVAENKPETLAPASASDATASAKPAKTDATAVLDDKGDVPAAAPLPEKAADTGKTKLKSANDSDPLEHLTEKK